MKKRKRYQLTENQLKSVVKVIPENYPLGVSDSNIDKLSGADRDRYDYISDVEYDKESGDIIFYVETYNGQTVTKRMWSGDDNFMAVIERELPKYGYDLQKNPEWSIEGVKMNGRVIVFTVSDYGALKVDVPIPSDYFIDIMPEIDSDEGYQYQEPADEY